MQKNNRISITTDLFSYRTRLGRRVAKYFYFAAYACIFGLVMIGAVAIVFQLIAGRELFNENLAHIFLSLIYISPLVAILGVISGKGIDFLSRHSRRSVPSEERK